MANHVGHIIQFADSVVAKKELCHHYALRNSFQSVTAQIYRMQQDTAFAKIVDIFNFVVAGIKSFQYTRKLGNGTDFVVRNVKQSDSR